MTLRGGLTDRVWVRMTLSGGLTDTAGPSEGGARRCSRRDDLKRA
jgi:hypothetical protein